MSEIPYAAPPNVFRDAASARSNLAFATHYLQRAVSAARCNGADHVQILEGFRQRIDCVFLDLYRWCEQNQPPPRVFTINKEGTS